MAKKKQDVDRNDMGIKDQSIEMLWAAKKEVSGVNR
jgi:hypothetical protein